MDCLPQELLDKIAQFLDHDDLNHALVVSKKFQYAVERASGRFACFTFKHLSYDERRTFIDVFSSHRFLYLRRVEICTKFAPLQPNVRERSYRQRWNLASDIWEPGSITCRESQQELDEKDEMFTRQIASCFGAIKAVEAKAVKDKAVKKPSRQSTGTIQLVVFTPIRHVHQSYCNHRRFSSWRVHLLSPDELPELYSVSGLSICNPLEQDYHHRQPAQSRIDLRVIIDLASRCPNLEYLGCEIGIDEWTSSKDEALAHYRHNHVGPLRDTRHDFGQAILNVKLPSALQCVQLHFISYIPGEINEQRCSPPNLVEPAPYDFFSSSLSLLSPNLKDMELRVMADKTLFWPHDNDKGSTWPNLERLNVMIHIRSPSGSWYFQDPPDIKYTAAYRYGSGVTYPPFPGSKNPILPKHCPLYVFTGFTDGEEDIDLWHDPEEHFDEYALTSRIVPVEENLVPLLESFAKAASRMSKLKRAMLWAPLTFNDEDEFKVVGYREGADVSDQLRREDFTLCPSEYLAWGIAYAAPGQPAWDGGESNSPHRQLWWRVGHWRPSSELRRLFQDIGRGCRHSQLIEHWTDSQYGDGLVAMEWFEEETFFKHKDGPLRAGI
jgi:hypothetical protein